MNTTKKSFGRMSASDMRKARRIKMRLASSHNWLTYFSYIYITLLSVFALIPFWLVVISSFTEESTLETKGFQLFTTRFSLESYAYLLKGHQIYDSYKISIYATVVGTLLALVLSSMFAYVISHRRVKYRNIMAFLMYFTFLFGVGLVGFYLLIARWLDLKDSIWALILPYLLNPFYTFIMVSFFRTLPYEINEAATVDGANEYFIFFRIIWPLSKPVLATIALFYALHYWNDWWLALLFVDDPHTQPLQMMIRQVISSINLEQYTGGYASNAELPSEGVKFATVCLTIGPIIFLYPMLQRYFVKGLTIGSVKG